MLKRIAKAPLHWVLNIAGRAYVPGHRLEDALAVAARLAPQGMACTLGYFHSPGDTPRQVAQADLAIAESVAALAPPGYVSIKAPACRYAPELIDPIALRAHELGILAHFDSHEIHTAAPTLACVRRAAALGGSVGMTLPGRWRRSLEDAEAAIRLGVRVRVVKGEWPDPAEPERDRNQGFMAVVERLAGRATQVAVATHDPRTARESLARLLDAGTQCELELLNGLPRRALLPIARELGIPVRIYIPFGIAWRPYAMAKLAENPRKLWWIARDGLRGLLSLR